MQRRTRNCWNATRAEPSLRNGCSVVCLGLCLRSLVSCSRSVAAPPTVFHRQSIFSASSFALFIVAFSPLLDVSYFIVITPVSVVLREFRVMEIETARVRLMVANHAIVQSIALRSDHYPRMVDMTANNPSCMLCAHDTPARGKIHCTGVTTATLLTSNMLTYERT